MKTGWRRYLASAVGLTLLVGVLVWGFWPRPVLVAVTEVRRAPFEVTVEEEGRTRVKDRFVISAPVAGYLRRVELHVGDPVVQGSVIARLDPMQAAVLDPRSRARAEAGVAAAEASLHQAEQAVAAARAEAQFAQTDFDRKQTLFKDGRVSREEVDRAETRLRQARAALRSSQFAVEVARFELDAARTALQYTGTDTADSPETVALRSPVDGRVLRVYRESEGPVQVGEALIELGDPTALEVEVDVLSEDAVRIDAGTPVRFQRWGSDPALEGAVRTVEPVGFTKISALGVEEQRVLVIADLTSPHEQWRRLGDGYRVEAEFVLWQAPEVLQIPSSALFRYRDGWAVFVMEDGRARRREVEVGNRNGLDAQIVAGLEPGEAVLTHPDERIEDGSAVEPHLRPS